MQRQNSGGWGTLCQYGFLLAVLLTLSAAPMPGVRVASAQEGKALPTFQIDRTEHNFGDVFIGEDVSCVFYINNLGTAPLELSETPIVTTGPKVGQYRLPSPAIDGDRSVSKRLQNVSLRRAAAPT